jgi:hypothetical protein
MGGRYIFGGKLVRSSLGKSTMKSMSSIIICSNVYNESMSSIIFCSNVFDYSPTQSPKLASPSARSIFRPERSLLYAEPRPSAFKQP